MGRRVTWDADDAQDWGARLDQLQMVQAFLVAAGVSPLRVGDQDAVALNLVGADTQQVLASVVRTARQRNLDLPPLITAMLRAAEPVVPELLGLPPPPA